MSRRPPFIPLFLTCVSLAGLALAADGGEPAYTVLADLSAAGAIKGDVRFDGQATQPRVWEVTRDTEICGATKRTQSVRAQGGGLGDVVIAIREIAEGKAVGQGPILSQQQCELVPRVLAMTAGQKLTMVNRDPLPVMISGRDQGNSTVFRFLQPVQGSKHKKHITEPGLIRVQGDDNRPWSRAVIYVADHPYVTVSAADGSFNLSEVPPGTWELIAWHETLGSRVATATVGAGQTQPVRFTFGASSP